MFVNLFEVASKLGGYLDRNTYMIYTIDCDEDCESCKIPKESCYKNMLTIDKDRLIEIDSLPSEKEKHDIKIAICENAPYYSPFAKLDVNSNSFDSDFLEASEYDYEYHFKLLELQLTKAKEWCEKHGINYSLYKIEKERYDPTDYASIKCSIIYYKIREGTATQKEIEWKEANFKNELQGLRGNIMSQMQQHNSVKRKHVAKINEKLKPKD